MPKGEVTAYMCMPPLPPPASSPLHHHHLDTHTHTHISNQSHSSCVCFCFFFVCVSQEVQGWYYLLGEDQGRKKHLKVPPQHDCRSNGNFIVNEWATECAEGIKSWKEILMRYAYHLYFGMCTETSQLEANSFSWESL